MPAHSWLLLIIISVLGGCSLWPTPEHLALNEQRMSTLLQQHCTPAPLKMDDGQQTKNTQQLLQIQEQLNMLTAATPGFTNSNCEVAESQGEYQGKTILGANEWIYLSPPNHHYQARIDSGAATSSLSAMDIEYFERNGKRWVRFQIQHDDEAQGISVEARVRRHVLIRQASSPEPERRPVVTLTVNIGNELRYDTEFTLTDRSQMTYPILMGREFLRDVSLIDVGKQFIHPKYNPQETASVLNKVKAAPAISVIAEQP